jgi:uncharacterized protein YyaL (SSP411 family)
MSAQATHQAIQWLPWGEDAFERALREDKLLLVDSGATWCHWCHVMDQRTYDDAEVADLIATRFIPVRIDRDRMMDVDAYLQRQPAMAGSQSGGWPLTVVMTPQGHLLFKATFVPPRSGPAYGTGLIDVLTRIDEYWRQHRAEVASAGERLHEQTLANMDRAFAAPGEIGRDGIRQIVAGIKDAYDAANGGLGGAPKFFQASAVALLLSQAAQGDQQAGSMAAHWLGAVARGGVRDQLDGGLHRYSVDERWLVPHFEKMASDNAAMLANYSNAAALLGREDFAQVARELLGWIGGTLRDADSGAFYASQDADVGPGDDGDYFTWTLDELRQACGNDWQAVSLYFGATAEGHMHDRHGRNVLHQASSVEQVAEALGIPTQQAGQAIARGKTSLVAARAGRDAPPVDRTVFADINGMMIDAHLTAWQRLGDEGALAAAAAAIDNALATLRDGRGVFAHYRDGGELVNIGRLADQAWMLGALVTAAGLLGEQRLLDAAKAVADYMLEHLVAADGALLSAPIGGGSRSDVPPGRPWDDAPSQSSASVACCALTRLGYLVSDDRYIDAAERALKSFAGAVQSEWASFLAGFALAMDQYIGARSIVVAGNGTDAAYGALAEAARRTFVPGCLLVVLDTSLPRHRDMLGRMGLEPPRSPAALVCRAGACLAPAHNPQQLREQIAALLALSTPDGGAVR